MIEILGDVLKQKDANAICFTSNGVVKSDGTLTMGAGNALAFKKKFDWVAKTAGEYVKKNGNVVGALGWDTYDNSYLDAIPYDPDYIPKRWVLNFPTKNHWKAPSDLALIIRSAKRLVELTNEHGWKKVYLCRPGCGLGQLSWEHKVKPALLNILDDRFFICHI